MAPFLVALVVIALCWVVGQALCSLLLGGAVRGAAGLVGLAAVVVVAVTLIWLPHGATVAAVGLGILVLASLAVLWRLRPPAGPALPALATVALVLAVVSLPFLSQGRVGIQGVSLNNDTVVHLVWAEGLRDAVMERLYGRSDGYPLGPHAVMAALAQVSGIEMADVLIGLLLATPVLLALAAYDALPDLRRPLRALVAAVVGCCFLVAAYDGQGAFKEIMQAGFIFVFAVLAGELLARAPGRRAWGGGALLALVLAGAVLTYSHLAVVWFAAGAFGWAVLALLVHRPALRRLPGIVAPWLPAIGAGALVAIVCVAPNLGRILDYLRQVSVSPAGGEGGIAKGTLGNLAGPLSPLTMLSQWPAADFRLNPTHLFRAIELSTLALVGAAFASVWWLRRRELVVPGFVLGAALVAFASREGQAPYVAAKSFVMLAPLLLLFVLRALLATEPAGTRSREGNLWRVALGAILVAGAAWSGALALRGSPVAASAQVRELDTMRPLLHGRPTLFLGIDDHIAYWLRGVPVTHAAPAFGPSGGMPIRPEKPYAYGQALDWDSIEPAAMDRFSYVIAPSTAYQSETPPNLRPVHRGRLYTLYERTGPTEPRETIERDGAPGAVLACGQDPVARRISKQDGTAEVRDAPPVSSGPLPPIGPGGAVPVGVPTGAGRFTLSARYTSALQLRIAGPDGQQWRLPANTSRPGPAFDFGTIERSATDGPLPLVVIADRASRATPGDLFASVAEIVATPEGGERSVPLRQACGEYVDWYRTAD